LAWLAIPLAMAGNLTEAVELAESSLSLARTLGSWPSQAVATAALCNILPMAGQSERAIELGDEGVAISRQRGELWARGYMLGAISQVHWRSGDRQLAEAEARAGAATKYAIDDRSGLQLLLQNLAWMAAEGGAHQRAAIILGSAEHLRQASRIEVPEAQSQQHNRSISLAFEGLGQWPYDEAYQRGLAMTVDDGVAYAVEDRVPSPSTSGAKVEVGIRLTKREMEIAGLIAQEMTSREIAAKLFISGRTVEAHVTNMLNKLGLNSRIELARWLASAGGTEPITPAA
jgi:non-specific serine/threonine protein kinase